MKKYILTIKSMKRIIIYKSINGYASWLSLVCFGLLIQIFSLLSIYTLNSAYLIASSRQSTIDLSCISHARHMIENNNLVRKCNYSKDNLILVKEATIMDKQVTFNDEITYIMCTYDDYFLRVYYDEKGISGIEYE